MNTPVVAGRKFTEQEDMAGNAPVLMINESAARRFFPGRSPLGESVLLAGKARRIVGVVKDMRDVRLDAPPEPQWFQPLFGSGTQLIVRVAGDASDAIPMLRREMLAADSRFVVNGIGSLDDIVATTVTERRMAMRLLSALAAIALGMASIGLYGVVSFNVARRHREFGVRSALGAQRHALLGMVLREGIGMALTGIAIGVGLSVWLTRVLERLLFQVSPTEPSTITMIAGLLLLVAVCASLVPAWRGASVDPAMALRADT
jgi:putative ABC transport system permease protein